MKTLIAIPSKGRAAIFAKNALPWLLESQLDWKVFLEKQDVELYNLPSQKVAVLPESNLGLGYSKEIIKQYAVENGYDAIFKVDDDVKAWTDFRKVLKPKESAAFFQKMLSEMEKMLEEKELLAGFGFPYSFQMFEKFSYKKTKRVQTAFLFRTKDFHADRSVDVFEDFAASLWPIVNGKLVLTCGKMGISMGVPVGGGTGGHQSFKRNEERAMNCCDAMRKIYPALKLKRVSHDWGIEPDIRSIRIGLYI